MSEQMPERVWARVTAPACAYHATQLVAHDNRIAGNDPACEQAEYIRADLHAAALAERDARIAALEAVLAVYAKRDNWHSPSTGFALLYDPEPSLIEKMERWKLAANALGEGEQAEPEPKERGE